MGSIDLHSTRDEAAANATPLIASGGGGGCACGGHDEELPELDVQTIPHAIRHASIFGALDSLRTGSGLVLSATHDPVPLLTQLQERRTGQFSVEYLDRGPQRWRLKIMRIAA